MGLNVKPQRKIDLKAINNYKESHDSKWRQFLCCPIEIKNIA